MNKFSIISLFILLSGCFSSDETAVKKAVLGGLKDPDSAKFGQFKLVDDKRACITVNAKNSYGGYVGDKQAFVLKKSGAWVLISTEEVSQDQCVAAIKQLQNY